MPLDIVHPFSKTLANTITLPTVTSVEYRGVWYDGMGYWIVDDLFVYKMVHRTATILDTVFSKDLSAIIPDFQEAFCIVGDGLFLYVGYFNTLDTAYRIAKICISDTNGVFFIKDIPTANFKASDFNNFLDITYDGMNFYCMLSNVSSNREVWRCAEYWAGSNAQYVGQYADKGSAIAFNGREFYTANEGGDVRITDMSITNNIDLLNSGLVYQAACFGGAGSFSSVDEDVDSSHYFLNQQSGLGLVLIYN